MRRNHGKPSSAVLSLVLVAVLLSGCVSASAQVSSIEPGPAVTEAQLVVPTQLPISPTAPAPTEAPAADVPPASPVIGPGYVPGYNPLTGLPAANVENLKCKPLLVSISEFPPKAQELQTGLSVASQIFRINMGAEDGTRQLAVFNADYADKLSSILANRLAEGGHGFVIGPIRSGRVVFEDIKTLFPGGLLITAGASAEVARQLSNRVNVFGSDPNNVNSAGLDPAKLQGITPCNADPASYAGLIFDPTPPAGGAPAPSFRVIYSDLNRVEWTYEAAGTKYLESRDRATGRQMYPSTDSLTGEPLGFPNVVVLFAQHRYVNRAATITEVELLYVQGRKGLLFRDGQYYDIGWSTLGGKLKLTDKAGEPIALKPGPTYFEVVSFQSEWDPSKLEVHFHGPPLP
jgi:Protein of unknown function (DUF3048) C-terminal domain/Protein of unknown function (DUF3048) N-terminal domain